jgi:hypothetical protein
LKHLADFQKFESLSPEIKLIEDTILGGDHSGSMKDEYGHLTLEDFEDFKETTKGWIETPFASRGMLKAIVLGADLKTQRVCWRIYDKFFNKQEDIPYEEQERAMEAYNRIGTEEWKHDNRGNLSGRKFNF